MKLLRVLVAAVAAMVPAFAAEEGLLLPDSPKGEHRMLVIDMLRGRLLKEPATTPLAVKARRNGVPEAIDTVVLVPPPKVVDYGSWFSNILFPLITFLRRDKPPLDSDAWLQNAITGVTAALQDAALPANHPYEGDAVLPKDVKLYTSDGIGPLEGHQIARMPNGTVLVVVGKHRPFVWPVELGGRRLTSPRAPLVNGKPIELEPLCNSPRILRAHNLLTDEECDGLVGGINGLSESHKLQRSTTGGKRGEGGTQVNRIRTSENAFDTDSKLAMQVIKRSFDLLGIYPDYRKADGLQLVRYSPGQAYNYHNDAFEKNSRGDFDFDASEKGSNRFATVFMYCNTTEEGGQTVFPHATGFVREQFKSSWADRKEELLKLVNETGMTQDWELEMVETCHSKVAVKPKRGDGVIFYSQHVNGDLDAASRHGGCPVLQGLKWSANLWIWSGARPGTTSYYENSVDAIVQNRYPGRVTLIKDARTLGSMMPEEKVSFHMFPGEKWRVEVADTSAYLTAWVVKGRNRTLFVIPPVPDEKKLEFSSPRLNEATKPKAKPVETQPVVVFYAKGRKSWAFWVDSNGKEQLLGLIDDGGSQWNTFHGHTFRVRDTNISGGGSLLKEYKVAQDQKRQEVHIGSPASPSGEL